jgi:glycerol-3-phosphate dehydrogenase (NAD(P)+)
MMPETDHIAVLGAGTWGITLAALLADNGQAVAAWDIAPAVIDQLARDRSPTRLPHLRLPEGLRVTSSLPEAMEGAGTVIVVAPSHAVRGLCRTLRDERLLGGGVPLVLCSKGIEEDTLALMTEVVAQELGAETPTTVLSGPSHAEEVSKQIPTAVVAAAEDPALAERIQALFNTDRFRVYTQSDVVGVELAAALKNVIAISAGACVGLGLGDNSLAALIARGLAEITRLGKRRGAHPETFAGLAGIGDLVVTAMSEHSRNRRFGRLMAEGRTAEEAQAEIGMVVEGVRTARAARALSQREEIYMPITEAVVAVIDGHLPVTDAVDALMAKDPKPEIYMTLDDLQS